MPIRLFAPGVGWRARRPRSPAERGFLGLSLSAGRATVTGASVQVAGHGVAARVQTTAHVVLPLSAASAQRLRSLEAEQPPPWEELASLAAEITDLAIDAASQLVSRAGERRGDVLAIGLLGLEAGASSQAPTVELGDAARLAEATGLSVIDSFASADLARQGAGAPLMPLPYWLALGDRADAATLGREPPEAGPRRRLLWELGRFSRLTVLPAAGKGQPWENVAGGVRFQQAPGLLVLDRLVQRATAGAEPFDHGGRLGAQGRFRADLARRFAEASPPAKATGPVSIAQAIAASERWLEAADEAMSSQRCTLHDVLRTATYVVAQTLASQLLPWLEPSAATEVVLSGGGRRNGLLLREILSRLPADAAILPISAMSMADEALRPTAAALLAMLHVDQVPGNLPHLTGARSPRILGRLTPGGPVAWRRLLLDMAAHSRQTLSLREAI